MHTAHCYSEWTNDSCDVTSTVHSTKFCPQTAIYHLDFGGTCQPLDRARATACNADDLTLTLKCLHGFNGYTDGPKVEDNSRDTKDNEAYLMDEDIGFVTSSYSMTNSPPLSGRSWSTITDFISYKGDEALDYSWLPVEEPTALIHLDSSTHIKEQEYDALASLTPPRQQGPITCAQCKRPYGNYKKLEEHGKRSGHLPFQCPRVHCSKLLPRRDTFKRHVDSHLHTLQLRCKQCAEVGVEKQFKRKDHLSQHMKKCHNHYSAEDRQKEALWNMVHGLGGVLIDEDGLDAEALKPRIDELNPRTVKPLLQDIARRIERTVQQQE
ncbi:hypothetical protein AMS68_007857 [Peltaster fructicola]|uniref:C2H2-type domain-containing protein n=1 Tax=Peltaster fructicola TaxID=286661 RepID=A0A6H0Y6W5_9PEZI|nr:hypothetical protein AMS68_007857 [Peltaster fructicola]